jgi:histidinol-phosphate aminotransferase
MNANENLLLPKSFIQRKLAKAASETDPRIYPTAPEVETLKCEISKYTGLNEDHISIGCGADQLIDLLCQMFLRRGERVAVVKPTFPMYHWRAEIAGGKVIEAFLEPEDFQISERTVEDVKSANLLFIASPNNPTGNQHTFKALEAIVSNFQGIAIIDETYVEYGDFSVIPLIKKYENVVILRTFSKAFGMAGLRLGYLLGSSAFIRLFETRVQYPFPVSDIAVRLGCDLLRERKIVLDYVEKTKHERRKLIESLRSLERVRVFESNANFVLMSFRNSSPMVIAHHLLKDKILIRVFPRLFSNNVNNSNNNNDRSGRSYLRVTVGTRSMNNLFIESLKRFFNN